MWVDRWTDGEDMIYCIKDNSQWSSLLSSPLSSPLPHMTQTIDSQNLKISLKWDQKIENIDNWKH